MRSNQPPEKAKQNHLPTSLKNKFIVVEGPIGVGKTSLVRLLTEKWNAEGIYETFEENPFLTSGFYKDKANYAFNTEVFFLLSRVREQLEISKKKGTLIADYFFEKNALFSELNLSHQDLEIYKTVYETFQLRTRTPDLVVYLYADVETLLQRVHQRDRQFERSISKEYLESLSKTYNRFFGNYTNAPILPINTRGIDFVRDPQQFSRIAGLIEERILGYRQLSLKTKGRARKVVNG